MKQTTMTNYIRIISYLKPYTIPLIGSVILTLLFSAANVFFLPLTRDLIHELSQKNSTLITNQIINACMLFGLRVLTQFGQLYLTSWISNRIVIDIQLDVYRKLQEFSQHFYSHWKLGEILTRIFSDSTKVKDAILTIFWEFLPQIFTLIGVLVYLFNLSWKLTLFSLVMTPLFVLLISYFANLLKRVTYQVQKTSSDITHIAQETLSNIKLVQAYTMEKKESARFLRDSMRNFKANMTITRFQATLGGTMAYLQFAVIVMVIFFGGMQMTSGSITGPELASFLTGIMLLIEPVNALSNVYTNVQQSMVSSERIFEIMDTPVVIKNKKGAAKITIKGDVVLDDIYFKYQDTDILKGLSLTAKEGETIAIVGLSGAGKTTLINLIPRFYDIYKGSLTIDGYPINQLDIPTLRSQIGIVAQDDMLFRGTISENIRYGQSESKQTDIINAAKLANAWEFIEKLPDGLHTKVGDKGRRLSGGQQQRIAIARAILRDPKILILDEATSALDSKSERLVQDALIKLMKNRTTFVIAHRLSTVMHANQIIVLDHGKIVERGTHQELLKQKGQYHKLYQLQFNKDV